MRARQIYQGLLARGASPVGAVGLLANMQAEAGLNPGINEINPVVPGSRGGWGLNQWTGPRRRQFEDFAKERGAGLDDLDTQLDFTIWELANTERKAGEALRGAKTPEEAAQIVSNQYLRPGVPHMDRRLAYAQQFSSLLGGDYTPPPIDQMQPVNGGSTMQQGLLNMIQKEDSRTLGQRLKDGAKDGSLWDALAMGFNTMRGPMADQGLAQSVGARMDQRQEQGKRNQTADWLESIGNVDMANAVRGGVLTGAQALEMMQPQQVKLQTFTGPDGTVYQFNPQTGETAPLTGAKDPSMMGSTPAEIQALEWRAKEAGLEPGTDEYRSFILNGGKAEGDEGPAAFQALHRQAIAAGFEPDSEEYRNFMATRGAGLAAEARAIGSAAGEAQASAESDYQTAQNALDLIDSIRNDPAIDRGTGKSSLFNAMPGTKGYDFSLKVEQAKGGAFLTAVQTMKGLGALSNNEGQAATAAITRMSTASTKEGFLSALDDYEKIVRQGLERAAAKGGGPVQPSTTQLSDDDYLKSLGLE